MYDQVLFILEQESLLVKAAQRAPPSAFLEDWSYNNGNSFLIALIGWDRSQTNDNEDMNVYRMFSVIQADEKYGIPAIGSEDDESWLYSQENEDDYGVTNFEIHATYASCHRYLSKNPELYCFYRAV